MTNAAEMQIVVELKDKASASLKNVNKSFSSTAAGITKGVAKMAAGFALLMGAAAIGGTIIALKKSVDAFIDFEDAMASVAKTTGLAGEALAELSDGIKSLSKDIPLAAVELAEIAAVAGQLGIQGTDNILAFTNTVSQISVAFGMTVEQSATAMAKLGKIYDIPIEQTSNLASAINVLGNSTAASESQLSAFGMSLGASSKNLGFTATESMALGATLISMGMDASDAGTRLNTAFTRMATNIDKVSEFLGMSEDAFRDAFGKAPMDMVIKVVQELNKIEDPLLRAETASKMFGIVGAKAFTGLGGNLDGLIINLENSAQGFEENTSLAEEFAAKTNTLKASIQILKNNLNVLAITIGEKLAPYIKTVVDYLSDLLSSIDTVTTSADGMNDSASSLSTTLSEKLKPGIDSLKSSYDSLIEVVIILTSDISKNEDALSTLITVADFGIATFNLLSGALERVLGFFARHPEVTKATWEISKGILRIISPILDLIDDIVLLATFWDTKWQSIKETINNAKTSITNTLSAIKIKIETWKNNIISIFETWYNKIVDFFDFTGISVKWPTIPDPFAGVDWCGSIPSWVKDALGICGGTTPTAIGYEKYNVYQEPDLPPYERAAAPAPHSKYSKHDRSHSEYDVWTQHDKSGHEKWQRVHMADGGPVNKDLDARLHEGEYVVPKAGTLVMGGSPQKDGHVQMTYNIGTVNGMDGLEKLLEKHDRELYRRLVSLV